MVERQGVDSQQREGSLEWSRVGNPPRAGEEKKE